VAVRCGEVRTASIANDAVHFVYRILRTVQSAYKIGLPHITRYAIIFAKKEIVGNAIKLSNKLPLLLERVEVRRIKTKAKYFILILSS
jgi:hypothetical protein